MRRTFLLFVLGASTSGAQDPRYTRRVSDCRGPAVTGATLSRATTGSIAVDGFTASRTDVHVAPAVNARGGDIYVCTEYGRVEIEDSDGRDVRIQVRLDAYGEGADDPGAAARRVIEETSVRVHVGVQNGDLQVHVWNDTLSFTASAQPAFVSIRVQVPDHLAYRLTGEAYHGFLGIRRLTLGNSTLRTRVGDKFKGIPGYIGLTDIDQIVLAGDVSITSDGNQLSAPVVAKLRVASSGSLTIRNGADINVSVQPHPQLGVSAVAASGTGAVRVLIDGGTARDTAMASFRAASVMTSPEFSGSPRQLRIVATSTHGSVNVASMPAAPLQRRQ